jgi:hypothetical protein
MYRHLLSILYPLSHLILTSVGGSINIITLILVMKVLNLKEVGKLFHLNQMEKVGFLPKLCAPGLAVNYYISIEVCISLYTSN